MKIYKAPFLPPIEVHKGDKKTETLVEVLEAVEQNDLNRIKQLIDEQPDRFISKASIPSGDPKGPLLPLLSYVIFKGRTEIADYLLDKGADPNEFSNNLLFISRLACNAHLSKEREKEGRYNKLFMRILSLAKECIINPSDLETSPLDYALYDSVKAEALLAKGAKVSFKSFTDKCGYAGDEALGLLLPSCRSYINKTYIGSFQPGWDYSPLTKAIVCGNKRNIIKLLEFGADPNLIRYRDFLLKPLPEDPPLIMAIEHDFRQTRDLAKDLLLALKSTVVGLNEEERLRIVSNEETNDAVKLDVIKALLHYGAVVNYPEINFQQVSFSPLATAAKEGSEEIVNELLNRDAKVNVCVYGHHCLTPLAAAYEGGNLKVVEMLFNNGADIQLKTPDGNALNYLVYRGDKHLFAIKDLLNRGIDPNVMTEHHETPLMKASRLGFKNIVSILLMSANTNPELEDEDGKTALDKAVEALKTSTSEEKFARYEEIIDLLESKSNE